MNKYLYFIEKFSLEDWFYCKLTDVYNKNSWEVSWNQKKNGTKKPWAIKFENEEEWTSCNKRELLDLIYQYKIDILQFEDELISAIKSMLVFSVMMQDEAKVLLGDDIITNAVSEYEDFAKSFVDAIKNLVPSKDSKDNEKNNKIKLEEVQTIPKDEVLKNKETNTNKIETQEPNNNYGDTSQSSSPQQSSPNKETSFQSQNKEHPKDMSNDEFFSDYVRFGKSSNKVSYLRLVKTDSE